MPLKTRPTFDGALDQLIPPRDVHASMHAPTLAPEPPADHPPTPPDPEAGMHAPMLAPEHETAPPTDEASPHATELAIAEPPTHATIDPDTPATTPAPSQPRTGARVPASKRARKGASMHAPMQPSENGLAVISAVRRGHAERQLAFRVSADEYKRLDRVSFEISDAFDGKVSKQDVVRLGLQMVLTDHEANGEGSLLTRLAQRKLRDL